MKTRRLVLSVVAIGVLVAACVAGFVTNLRPQLGLDLVGGISVVLEGPPGTGRDVMERTLENIRNRIDALGVAEPDLQIVGDRSIQVQVPGLAQGRTFQRDGRWCATAATGEELGCTFSTEEEAEAEVQAVGQQRLLDLIGRTARLEERQVIDEAPYIASRTKLTACPPELAAEPQCNDPELVECLVSQPNRVGCRSQDLADQQVTYVSREDPIDGTRVAYTLDRVRITGEAFTRATAVFQTAGQGAGSDVGWMVNFQLTRDGAARFGQITTELVGEQLAIILDSEVQSAPVIEEPITGGQGRITGNFTEQEAKDLALVLQLGALPVELSRQNVETVSPTLGETSLRQGLIAGLAGLALLMLYLAFYYRLLGVVTWLGMAIWAIFSFTLVSVLGRTIGYSLTLAGIAGLVVSIGITADSYIVFYERLKDEVRSGKTLRAAVSPAFKRAWHTIISANLVTILAAGVLYLLAVGSVRGFALTLGLATALDMFVVYFFKRPAVFLIARNERLANMRGFGLRSGVAADPVPVVAGGAE